MSVKLKKKCYYIQVFYKVIVSKGPAELYPKKKKICFVLKTLNGGLEGSHARSSGVQILPLNQSR